MAGNPLCFPGRGDRPRSPGARPPRKPLVLRGAGGRKELRGEGRTGAFFRAGKKLSLGFAL